MVYRSDTVDLDIRRDLLPDVLAGCVALPDIPTTRVPISPCMLGKAPGDDGSFMDAPISAIGEKADNFVTFYARSSQPAQLFQQVKGPCRTGWALCKEPDRRW